jgi:hypothetical protein
MREPITKPAAQKPTTSDSAASSSAEGGDPLHQLRHELEGMQAKLRQEERAEKLKKNTRYLNPSKDETNSQSASIPAADEASVPAKPALIQEITGEKTAVAAVGSASQPVALVQPKYTIVERNLLGMEKFAYPGLGESHEYLNTSSRPDEIDVKISLPGVVSLLPNNSVERLFFFFFSEGTRCLISPFFFLPNPLVNQVSKSEIEVEIDSSRLILQVEKKYKLEVHFFFF